MPEPRYRKTGRFLSRVIDGEAVLVPLVENAADLTRIFRLDPVGTWIWEALDGSPTRGELLRGQAEAFEVGGQDAAGDLARFLEELAALGAIEEAAREG